MEPLSSTNIVVAWLLSIMTSLAPPERLAAIPQLPGWAETAQEKRERYEQIAQALYEVVYDPQSRPLYGGNKGRAYTALQLLTIAYMESGFAKDVDKGPCYRGPGFKNRCDAGRAKCLMQIRVDVETVAGLHGVAGLAGDELHANRHECFRAGLHMVRRSFRACSKLGPDHRLDVYASGRCNVGFISGRARLKLAERIWHEKKPNPGPDSAFLLPLPEMPPLGEPVKPPLASDPVIQTLQEALGGGTGRTAH
jgi:hypothetical protein